MIPPRRTLPRLAVAYGTNLSHRGTMEHDARRRALYCDWSRGNHHGPRSHPSPAGPRQVAPSCAVSRVSGRRRRYGEAAGARLFCLRPPPLPMHPPKMSEICTSNRPACRASMRADRRSWRALPDPAGRRPTKMASRRRPEVLKRQDDRHHILTSKRRSRTKIAHRILAAGRSAKRWSHPVSPGPETYFSESLQKFDNSCTARIFSLHDFQTILNAKLHALNSRFSAA